MQNKDVDLAALGFNDIGEVAEQMENNDNHIKGREQDWEVRL